MTCGLPAPLPLNPPLFFAPSARPHDGMRLAARCLCSSHAAATGHSPAPVLGAARQPLLRRTANPSSTQAPCMHTPQPAQPRAAARAARLDHSWRGCGWAVLQAQSRKSHADGLRQATAKAAATHGAASSPLTAHIATKVYASAEGAKSWRMAPTPRPWGSRAPRREQRGQVVQRRLRGWAVPDAPPDERRAGGLRQAHPRPGVGLMAGLLDDDLVAGADAARAPVGVRHGRKQLRGAGPERDLAHAVRVEQRLRGCRR